MNETQKFVSGITLMLRQTAQFVESASHPVVVVEARHWLDGSFQLKCSHSPKLARVQIERQFAGVKTPVEEVESEEPMRIVRFDMVGKPNHFTHVQGKVH
ncbi:MAG: hypothetical protein P8J20_12705 [Novosphingobium sp.]|nr:hypothetical protein [Novosphingobium sp.]